MKRTVSVLAAVILAVLAVQDDAFAERCDVEHARYALRGSPEITGGFRAHRPDKDWFTDVFFFIHSAQTNRTFWFLPFTGNGQGISEHLASTTDVTDRRWMPPGPDGGGGSGPLGDLDVLFADKSYQFMQAYPLNRRAAAPAHIFIPDLQRAFWYHLEPREGVAMAFFDLAGCTQKPR